MTTKLHQALAELVEEQPQNRIDLDRQIARGRRRARYRTIGTVGLATAAVLAAAGGIVALQPDEDALSPANSPSAPDSPRVVQPGVVLSQRPTEKSGALAAQLEQLAPEIARTPGARRYNSGSPAELHAGALWNYPVGELIGTVALVVDVAEAVSPVCTSMSGPEPCDEIKQLPGGSTAYRKSYPVDGVMQHEVRIKHPDGIQVSVSSSAQLPPPVWARQALLDADRVLEVAQGVTITP